MYTHTHTHTHRNTTQPSKERDHAICSNDVDGARGYYAKWNKSIRERQIPYDFTHMWNLRMKKKWAKGKKRRSEANQETDSTIENKLITRCEVSGEMG